MLYTMPEETVIWITENPRAFSLRNKLLKLFTALAVLSGTWDDQGNVAHFGVCFVCFVGFVILIIYIN